MSDPPLRVVVADDHYLVREGIRELLGLEDDLTVVATVGSAVELLDVVERHEADVVVTDIRMPPDHRTEGIDAALRIRTRHPKVGVVVLSAHADDAYAMELFRDGTSGLAYLLKDRVGDRSELARAIRATAAGDSLVDPMVVDAMVRRSHRRSSLEVLTPRERSVLEQMASGSSNPAIAAALFLSVSGVEKHITAIFGKLGLGEEMTTHRRVTAVLAYLGER